MDALITATGPVCTGRRTRYRHPVRARYRHLINRMSALVAQLSPSGEIIYLNDAITPICGFSAADLVGTDWFDLLLPLGALMSCGAARAVSEGDEFEHTPNRHPLP